MGRCEARGSTEAESRRPPSEVGGTPPRPFPRDGRAGSDPGQGSRQRPLPRSDEPPRPTTHTWGDPQMPPPLALSPCPASLHYTSRGAVGPEGRGPLGLWGRGRHVPPLSANAEPCGEVTCRCLALLCAPGSVGAQSVARRLGLSSCWDPVILRF